MKKIGLVVEGGGMRGIYGAGVLDRFLDEGIEFPYCIGVSAGSANIASFLSKQKGRNYRYYKHHAHHKKYMSLENAIKKGSYMGLEYIYDTLTNKLDAIDYDVLLNSKSEVRIVAVRASDAQSIYFDESSFNRDDCRVLMASCAVPAINRPIEIDGVKYFDGGVTDPIPFEKAIDDGCDSIVVILSRQRGYIKKPENFKLLYSKILAKYPAIIEAMKIRHLMYNEKLSHLYELEEAGKAVLVVPTRDVKLSMVGKNGAAMDELYSYALEDAEKALEKIISL